MPNSKSRRKMLQRQIGYAWWNIETAQQHLLEVKQAFAPNHPQLAMLLELAMQGLEQSLQTVKTFALASWGHVPDKVERWRNSGSQWRDEQREVKTCQESLPMSGNRTPNNGCPPS